MNNPQMGCVGGDNPEMKRKFTLGQSLAANLLKLRQDSLALNTYAKLAKRAGVGGGTVERAEKNLVSVTLETVEKLAEALEVDPIELLAEPGRRPISFTQLDPLEAQLVMFYRSLIDADKDRLLLYANDLHNAGNPGQSSVANPFPKYRRRVTDE